MDHFGSYYIVAGCAWLALSEVLRCSKGIDPDEEIQSASDLVFFIIALFFVILFWPIVLVGTLLYGAGKK